jgi:1-deoxy-D-xylulose-5-phosphate synthase
MLILAPASRAEQQDMLRWAIKDYNGPVAIRYPRGGDRRYRESAWTASFKTDSAAAIVCHRRGADVTFITYGTMLDNVLAAAERLSEDGIEATVLRLLTVSSFPIDRIAEELSQNKQVIIVEEVCSGSGISDALTIGMKQRVPHCIVNTLDLGPNFVTHGSVDTLYEHLGLDSRSIAAYTKEVLKHES